MKALITIACGAIAAACGSNKPAEEPAHYAEGSTTVTMGQADTPRRSTAPEYGDPSAPSDPATSARSRANGTNAGSELATFRAPIPANPPPVVAPGSGPSEPDAVVTKKNQAGAAPTAVEQGTSDVDRMITQQIRRAVIADSALSATAKNIQIITQGGKVTLRGAVKRDEERQTIDASARKVAGSGNVDNQLEVTK